MGVWLIRVCRKVGASLGLKRNLSNGNEPAEVTDILAAFEVQNRCKITFSGSLKLHKGYMDMEWEAQARSLQVGLLEPSPLVLASARVWAGDFKTLMAALFRLLYALDFQLAENEFAKAGAPKA